MILVYGQVWKRLVQFSYVGQEERLDYSFLTELVGCASSVYERSGQLGNLVLLVKTCAKGKHHQEMSSLDSSKARDLCLGCFLNSIVIKWLVRSSW